MVQRNFKFVNITKNTGLSPVGQEGCNNFTNDVTLTQEKEVRFIMLKESLKIQINNIYVSNKGVEANRSLSSPTDIEKTENIWEKLMSWNNDIIEPDQIEEKKI